MSTLQLWRKFAGLPSRRRALAVEAAFWLLAARLAIVLLPFPWIARRIGRLHAPARSSAVPLDRRVIWDISWAIDRAAMHLPLRLVCLPRALAAWQMLHRRGIAGRVHFGASRRPSEERLSTHAWVDAYGVEVTGYPEAYDCVEIGYFAQESNAAR